MPVVKITTIGSSTGIILTPHDPDFSRQMELAEQVMDEDREMLRELAKR